MKGQENNFTFLRIVACLMVITSHIPTLIGHGPNFAPFGLIGVIIFFSISGYLVTRSWDSDPDPARFLTRRALRIFPGLIASVLFCALIIGPLFTVVPLREYFSDPVFTRFLRNVFLFPVTYGLPGLFATNPLRFIVNGPLWTLPMEVTMYISLAMLGSLRAWRQMQTFILVVGLAVASLYCSRAWTLPEAPKFLTMNSEQLILSAFAFCFGAVMARLPQRALVWWAFIPVSVVLAMRWQHAEMLLLITALVPYATLAIATRSTVILRSAGRFGDPSYGVYIYAFPIEQLAVHVFPSISTPAFSVASVGIPVLVGFASWHLIERPCLRWKPRVARTESIESSPAETLAAP